MSQILDALRRAEAQRSRGRVPGLHQTSGPLPLPSGVPRAAQRRPMFIAGALALTLLAVAALWLMLGRAEQNASTPAVPAAAVDQPLARSGAAPMPAAERGSNMMGRQNAASQPEPPIATLPRKAQLTERRIEAREIPGQPPAEPLRTVKGAEAQAVAVATRPATASEPSKPLAMGAAELPKRQQLAPDVQRSLPPITVSGSVYSSDSAQRMLVVNGEIWREGDQIGPGLVLEQIRRRDAILRYNGIRFTVGP